jgi:hypothetical protein
MKTFALLVLLLALPTAAQAQNTLDPKAWVEQFLNTIVEDGPEKANHILVNNSRLGARRPDKIRSYSENMRQAEEFYGTATGHEILAEKKWGESILIYLAIVKRERTPVFWRFVFYRYSSNWNLISFTVRDKFQDVNIFSLF